MSLHGPPPRRRAPPGTTYSEVSNLGDTNRPETGMDAGYAVVQIADF